MHDFSNLIIHDYLIDTNMQNICYFSYSEFLNEDRNPGGNLVNAYDCVEKFRSDHTPQAVCFSFQEKLGIGSPLSSRKMKRGLWIP